jgi:hypothetical protein
MLGRLLADGHYRATNRLKLPLYAFIAHLSDELLNAERLRNWLADARAWLEQTCELDQDDIDSATTLPPQPTLRANPDPYLFVQVDPDLYAPDQFVQVSWKLHIDDGPHTRNQTGASGQLPLTDHAAIARTIASAPISLDLPGNKRPRIEVLLPFDLLSNDDFIDTLERTLWRRRDRKMARASAAERLLPSHLAGSFPLVLRCWERSVALPLGEDLGGLFLREHWAAHADRCLEAEAALPCLEWPSPTGEEPRLRLRSAILHDNAIQHSPSR